MSFDRLPRSVRAAIRTPADLLTEPDATVRAALIPARALDDEGRTAPLWLLLWSYRAECFHVEEAVSTVAHGHEFLYRPRSQGAPDYIPLYFGTQDAVNRMADRLRPARHAAPRRNGSSQGRPSPRHP